MMDSDRNYEEFKQYLRQCTDAQVLGVWRKERDAGRVEYRRLAAAEWDRRGYTPEDMT